MPIMIQTAIGVKIYLKRANILPLNSISKSWNCADEISPKSGLQTGKQKLASHGNSQDFRNSYSKLELCSNILLELFKTVYIITDTLLKNA